MEFKNGYNFLYQKAKAIYASKLGRPGQDDEPVDTGLTDEEKKNIKLVYETKEGIVVNFTGLPTTDDKQILLTVDGEPVIGPSGGIEPVPVAMVPFELNQAIRGFYFGNVKNGDINEELEAFLANIDAEMAAFVYNEANGMLIAYNFEDEAGEIIRLIGYSGDGSGMPTVLYSTWTGDLEGIQLTRGYMNLTDGCFECPAFTIQGLNYEISDTSWNGKFIGAIVAGPGPAPSTLNKMRVGDVFSNFHINTSVTPVKDDFYFPIDGSSPEPSPLQMGYGPTWCYKANNSQGDEAFMVTFIEAGTEIPMGEDQTIVEALDDVLMVANHNGLFIYVNDEAVRLLKLSGDIPEYIDPDTFKAGWQFEGDTLADLIATYPFAFPSDIDYYYIPVDGGESLDAILAANWNGKLCGFTDDDYTDDGSGSSDDPSEPATLTPFEVGQYIGAFDFGNVNNGDLNTALGEYLLGLEVSMEPATLVVGTNDVMLMATHIAVPESGIDAGVLFGSKFDHEGESDIVFFYSTAAFEMDGMTIQQGYQNLTNGKYGYLDPAESSEVTYLRDDEALWNGIFAGAVVVEGGSSSSDDPSQPDDPSEPAPVYYNVTTNSIDNATISGDGEYTEGDSCTIEIAADTDYYFIESPTATLNGNSLALTYNGNNGYYAIFTVNENCYVEFTAELEAEEPEDPGEDEVYDCTGTWQLSPSFTALAVGTFEVQGSVEYDYGGSYPTSNNFDKLLIGYEYDSENDDYNEYSGISGLLGEYSSVEGMSYYTTSKYPENTSGLTITITGGADAESADLYDWLQQNQL